jgi:hypothetical protein
MIPFISLYILFTILNWLDFYFTRIILRKGGKELNPVIKFLGLLPAKIAGQILIGLFGYFGNWAVLIPVDMILIGTCIWNYIQLRKNAN